jgi:replication initiation and membrane attachment protein DnaB
MDTKVLLKNISERVRLKDLDSNVRKTLLQLFEKYTFDTDQFAVAQVMASRTTFPHGVSSVT